MKKNKKVLVVGWDAADWKFLNPLIDAGQMPNLSKLINGGVIGNLATLDPPLSPTLWTSIATGKRPYKHGIHGFTEAKADGSGIRPIYSTNRKTKAIWNILSEHDLKTHVVGWWPSHPAENINGTMISNLYQRAPNSASDPWPMLKGTVSPKETEELFADLRIRPQELTGNHILPFIPDATKLDADNDSRVISVAKNLADCSTIHSAATYILENEEWDFVGVYYDAIDHFCHGFMKYHPPHRNHIPLKDYEMFKDVVNSACRYHDMMLGRLMELAGEETTIMLISDHGFYPDNNRPSAIPNEPAGPAIEHSPYGIFVLNGPGIKKDQRISGASLLDITPTVLSLYDLAVGKDMDGKVLVTAFEDEPIIERIESWDIALGGAPTQHDNLKVSDEEADAELKQLIELGYVADPGKNAEKAIQNTNNENNFNLARAYIDGGKFAEGIQLLEQLFENFSDQVRYGLRLLYAYQAVGEIKKARNVFEKLNAEQKKETPEFDMIEGTLLLAEGRYKKALAIFSKVESEAQNAQEINLRIAHAYFQLKDYKQAIVASEKELAVNSENYSAHYMIGLCHKELMAYPKALASFYSCLGLLFHIPYVHYQLGDTYFLMQDYEKAVMVLDTCLTLNPKFNIARKKIIDIYTNYLKEPQKANEYKKVMVQNTKGKITIVSGLPRSGTSLMMQMLEAGGSEIFTDSKRVADENNPKGYYEHEAIKNLQKSKAFVKDGVGKTMKVIAQLLKHLPLQFEYKVIFMQRDLMEVLSSQKKMLERDGKSVATDAVPMNLYEKYEKTLAGIASWDESLPNVSVLYVNYKEIVESPFEKAIAINDFLGLNLSVEKMASVVDKKLYREKTNTEK
jgi:predicted AlkP superfamily phosphohydrolase/phosphomutase/tetratricopeptide (TPR) repeat protein